MLMHSIHTVKSFAAALVLLGSWGLLSCNDDDNHRAEHRDLTSVASSSEQWTGVAVSKQDRIFANYPNWKEDHGVSVVEVTDSTNRVPFPDQTWNTWQQGTDPSHRFVCVQSVFVDRDDFLWVLDPANPQRAGEYLGVVPGGAKLVKVDLTRNSVVKIIYFNEPVIEKNSYLNDIRIDEDKQMGYMTDSNEGAIVVVNLETGAAHRYLAQDPTTKSENKILHVEGIDVRNEQGEYVNFHSDGIELNADRTFLYWRPINGVAMYRLPTALLNQSEVTDAVLSENIEHVGDFPPSDGLILAHDGTIYLTSIEENAIRSYREGSSSTTIVAQSDDLKWPDSFGIGSDGSIYVTTSQIHIKNPPNPYRIFKFQPN